MGTVDSVVFADEHDGEMILWPLIPTLEDFISGDSDGGCALDAAFERYRFERNVLFRPKQISSDYLNEFGLTKRRAEVALLVVQGESNREIASQLKITERTVEKQLQWIFSLLNVSSRAKLIAKINKMCVATTKTDS